MLLIQINIRAYQERKKGAYRFRTGKLGCPGEIDNCSALGYISYRLSLCLFVIASTQNSFLHFFVTRRRILSSKGTSRSRMPDQILRMSDVIILDQNPNSNVTRQHFMPF